MALYHAALCLWVYGVIARFEKANLGFAIPSDYVVLNDNARQDGSKCDRFFDLGKGTPMLSLCADEAPDQHMAQDDSDCANGLVRLTEPHLVMDLTAALMQPACDLVVLGPTSRTRWPNLVENLVQLMVDLGSAAKDEPFAMDYHM